MATIPKDKAKYTVFVTISKFLEQGGKLKKGRTIYAKYEMAAGYYPCSAYDHTDKSSGNIIVKNAVASFPISEMIFYVEIPCSPIFK